MWHSLHQATIHGSLIASACVAEACRKPGREPPSGPAFLCQANQVSQQHEKPKGAHLPTMLVYDNGNGYSQYAGAGRHPVCVYDRERAVIEAARRVAESIGAERIRVVFIVEAGREEQG